MAERKPRFRFIPARLPSSVACCCCGDPVNFDQTHALIAFGADARCDAICSSCVAAILDAAYQTLAPLESA